MSSLQKSEHAKTGRLLRALSQALYLMPAPDHRQAAFEERRRERKRRGSIEIEAEVIIEAGALVVRGK